MTCGHLRHSYRRRVKMGEVREWFAWVPCTWIDELEELWTAMHEARIGYGLVEWVYAWRYKIWGWLWCRERKGGDGYVKVWREEEWRWIWWWKGLHGPLVRGWVDWRSFGRPCMVQVTWYKLVEWVGCFKLRKEMNLKGVVGMNERLVRVW